MKINILEDISQVLPKYLIINRGKILRENFDKINPGNGIDLLKRQDIFFEGSEEIFKEKRRQKRSTELRRKAIEHYKLNCYVCGVNFEEIYGDYGAGYIEIHHLSLLADSAGEKQSTLDDVRVVCSNCHSVLHHQGRKPMNIDELKEFVQARRSQNHSTQ